MEIVAYIFFIIPIIAALGLGIVVPMLILLLFSYFSIGVFLVCLSFIIDTLTLGGGAVNIGINLFFPDIVFFLLGVAIVLRVALDKNAPIIPLAWLVFIATVFFSIGVGLVTYGSASGVQARSYFYFVISATYGMSFQMTTERLRLVIDALVICSVVLVLVTVYRWIVYYMPISSLLPPGGTYNIDGPIRVIYSQHAIVVAQVMVIAFFFSLASRGCELIRKSSPILLWIVLVLQHRSVWGATLAGVLTRLFVGRSHSGSVTSQIALVVGIVVVTVTPLMVSPKFSSVTQQIESSAQKAFSGGGTGGERLQSWGEIIKNWYGSGVYSILIGRSFGTDNTRIVKDDRGQIRKISYAAHNMYVQTLFNTGLIGLISYCVTFFSVMIILYKKKNELLVISFFILLVMQAVYYVPYGVDYLQALLFGCALAMTQVNLKDSDKVAL